MRASVLILSFTFLSFFCLAQEDVWYSGLITLQSEETVKGLIKVQLPLNVILFKHGENMPVQVVPAHKLKLAYLFDDVLKMNRQFTSVQQQGVDFTAFILYEVVLRGEVQIVRNAHTNDNYTDAYDYRYFIALDDQVVPIRKFKKKVFPRLILENEALSEFIDKNRLNYNSITNTIKIIQYYNEHCCIEPIAKL